MYGENPLSLATWSTKSRDLLTKSQKLLSENGFDANTLPKKVFAGDKCVSVVFAGQYSAGKSTILKALTGLEKIATGEGITTQEACTYDWNGIKVIDTPGIHTTLRPDHDDISYQAITDADMLVYVVTQELFDDYIGQNFRKLLLEKDKASEMILVVNKMADVGNTLENQEIKSKDLEKVTAPYTPAQLRTVFIDAESYLESLTEEDVEIAEELRERSNYCTFLTTLNSFVQEKGIPSQITTVLYQLFDVLQKAINRCKSSTGDTDIDALEEHLQQERHIIVNTQWRIETGIKAIYEEAASLIREKGREIANTVYDYKSEDEANEAITCAYNEVDSIVASCIDRITCKIEELSHDCQTELDDFYKSDFSQNLKFRLESKNNKGNPLIERIFKSDVLTQGSNKIIANTAGSNAAAHGLRAFSGSNVHQWVLDIGHFFGHSFKPWEAVKWVKGINVAGKVLGVFGVVLSLGMQVKEDIDDDIREQEMRSNREKLRSGFYSAANEVVTYFNNALVNYLSANYLTRVSEIDSQISEIRSMRIGKSKSCELLENLQNECRLLISDIHNSYANDDAINQN